MIAGDARQSSWLQGIPEKHHAVIVMEGVSMYLSPQELKQLLQCLCAHFDTLSLLMDCYTPLAAKLSKYRNPVHDLGVTQVYGLENPGLMEDSHFSFVQEHEMTPRSFTQQLSGMEKMIFQKLYAGRFSQRLYKLLEYRKMAADEKAAL